MVNFILGCFIYGHLVNGDCMEVDELLEWFVGHKLRYSDRSWLRQWHFIIGSSIGFPNVPLAAQFIHTPLILPVWQGLLSSYPCQEMAHFFLRGILEGFRLGCCLSTITLKSAKRNMHSALQHPDVVDEYIMNEVHEGRVVGPFIRGISPFAHVSRFGVIPKSGQPNKWRLIVDLSHPKGFSVNDGIPKNLCSMKYMKVDDAVKKIIDLGVGCRLAKIDVKSAFRLLPVHPIDRHLLAMEWRGQIYNYRYMFAFWFEVGS